jgi:hypothetical protein
LTQLPPSDLGTSSGTRVSATWHKWPNSQSSSVLESYLSRSEAPRWNGEAQPVDVHVTLLRETTYELVRRVHVVDVVLGQPRPTIKGMVVVVHSVEAPLDTESLNSSAIKRFKVVFKKIENCKFNFYICLFENIKTLAIQKDKFHFWHIYNIICINENV